MFKLADNNNMDIELRMTVVGALQQMIDADSRIIALEADLGGASGWTTLLGSHPDNFINVGISEANMVGVAAGLSLAGYVPFIHTFGPFATRRVFDQIYISGAYGGNTINIYGSDPGFAAGPNGGTHTTWEDVALMRTLPHAIVCDAADSVQMDWILKEFAKLEGIHYVRGNRKAVRNVYAPGSTFELGKGNVIREGSDVLVIVAGQLVSDVLPAANRLDKAGISCEVVDMFTIKPIDKELVLSHAKGKKRIVTVENHSITGGLGSAVAEIIAEHGIPCPLTRIGVDDRFGQVGSQDFLQSEFGLGEEDIFNRIMQDLG